MRLLDVRYVVGSIPPEGYARVFEDSRTGLHVFEDSLAPGRVYFPERIERLASDDEVNANPRARSARLRVGERTEVPLSG